MLLVAQLRHQVADFEGRNHWQEANEQEEHEGEEANRAGVDPNVRDAWGVVAPGRRYEVASKADHDDHEALDPHADTNRDRDQEQPPDVRPNRLEPQSLGNDDVRQHQSPAPAAIRAKDPGQLRARVDLVAAVP